MTDTVPVNDRIAKLEPVEGSTSLVYDFDLAHEDDLLVMRLRGGLWEELSFPADYTFPDGLGDDAGGYAELGEPTEEDDYFLLIGARAVKRSSDWTSHGGIPSQILNEDMNRLTRMVQEAARNGRLALKRLPDEPASGWLPTPQPNRPLVGSPDGKGYINGPDLTDLGDALEAAEDAAASAAAAAASAASASTSATTATTKAGEASASATTATTKAGEASTSAGNALADRILAQAARVAADAAAADADADAAEADADASAAAADASLAIAARIAAEGARDAALAAFDNFDDKYLGAKAADPALDNDGNALADGAIYWNTTAKNWRAYDLATTSWYALAAGSTASGVTSTPAGNLSATNVQDALNELDAEKFKLSDVDTDGTLAANSDAKVPSQKAVRTYVAAAIAALRNGVSTAFDTLAEIATELGLKAPLNSPALTGTPTAPTASAGTNTTQIATTAFVLSNGFLDTYKAAVASLGGYAAKAFGTIRKAPNVLWDGFADSNGINAARCANYSVDTSAKCIKPTTTGGADQTATHSSNSAGGNTVSYSSQYASGGAGFGYMAFDKYSAGSASGTDSWVTAATTTGWIQYQFGSAKTIGSYSIKSSYNYGSRAPQAWTLQGSNTGAFAGEQVTLDTRSAQTGWNNLGEVRSFNIASPASYSYYRLNVTANNGDGTYLSLDEITLNSATVINNLTYSSALQTADAAVTSVTAFFEIDTITSVTLGTDLTGIATCNGWTNNGALTLSVVGKGQSGRTLCKAVATGLTSGTSYGIDLVYANNKNGPIHIVEVRAA